MGYVRSMQWCCVRPRVGIQTVFFLDKECGGDPQSGPLPDPDGECSTGELPCPGLPCSVREQCKCWGAYYSQFFPNTFLDVKSDFSQQKRCLGEDYDGIAQEIFFFIDELNCPGDGSPSWNPCPDGIINTTTNVMEVMGEGEREWDNDHKAIDIDPILP